MKANKRTDNAVKRRFQVRRMDLSMKALTLYSCSSLMTPYHGLLICK